MLTRGHHVQSYALPKQEVHNREQLQQDEHIQIQVGQYIRNGTYRVSLPGTAQNLSWECSRSRVQDPGGAGHAKTAAFFLRGHKLRPPLRGDLIMSKSSGYLRELEVISESSHHWPCTLSRAKTCLRFHHQTFTQKSQNRPISSEKSSVHKSQWLSHLNDAT